MVRPIALKTTHTAVFVFAIFVGPLGTVEADFIFGEAVNLGPTINSIANEQAPSISSDGLELYFSDHAGAPYRSGGFGLSDLWVTTRPTKDDPWGVPVNLGPVVNSSASDEHPSISADGLELYFGSTRAGGSGTHDLWVTTRLTKDHPWTEPVNLGSTVNSADSEWDPEISADGLSLYFADYLNFRLGGHGIWDLYTTRRDTVTNAWGTPVNMGLPINSSSRDASPSISGDNLVLFLNTERPGGVGGSDIWMARRISQDADWGPPIPLGPAINQAGFDATPEISADGSTLYFGSERPGGSGNVDLWQASIIPVVDFNGDGTVNSEDRSILMDHWGQDEPSCDIGPMPWGDGIVDFHDLNILAEYVDGKDLATVHTPSPHAVDVSTDVVLRWLPAELADRHDVYFGVSFGDVYGASRDDPRDVLVSQDQSVNTFDAGELAFGQTYYWRIDEVIATFEPTIYEGFVVDFTTEPLAYPLDSVSATASASEAGAGPENTVNGSGLNDDGEHSTVATDMWLASGNGVDPVWIQYGFDKAYRLHEMLLWNYNVQFELALGFGLKEVTVEYSENDTDWTVLGDVELAQATAAATYTANTTIDLGGVAAKYVRLTVNSGWGMMGKFGLSEVRFLYIPTRARKPEPADGRTDVRPDTMLEWRAGREAVAHDVYFSTDRQAVVNGTALVDTATENSYLPGPLDPGQTYYWRIDEINEAETVSVWEGDVWEFTTAE